LHSFHPIRRRNVVLISNSKAAHNSAFEGTAADEELDDTPHLKSRTHPKRRQTFPSPFAFARSLVSFSFHFLFSQSVVCPQRWFGFVWMLRPEKEALSAPRIHKVSTFLFICNHFLTSIYIYNSFIVLTRNIRNCFIGQLNQTPRVHNFFYYCVAGQRSLACILFIVLHTLQCLANCKDVLLTLLEIYNE
jgi:hypothetical protein